MFQMFFEEQLKKHDNMCALIQANLDAQEKILRQISFVFCCQWCAVDYHMLVGIALFSFNP